MASPASTRTAQTVKASPPAVYAAFMDPDVLMQWLPPPGMRGVLHRFDGRVGGGYVLSLFYSEEETRFRGKTADREDRIEVRFLELDPARRIVEAVTFVSDDPVFAGEMRVEIGFAAVPAGTEVIFRCTDLPPGLKPDDNATGTRLSLQQLADRFE